MNSRDVESLIMNPFYAVTFASHVFKQHSEGSKEDWVAANLHLIEDIGPKAWLNELLDVLSQTKAKYDGHDIVNPTLATNVSDQLRGDHEPLVTREQWVQANTKLIDEISIDTWLWHLLEVLETGGPTN